MEPSPPGRRRVVRAATAAAGLLAIARAWPVRAQGQGPVPPGPRVLRIGSLSSGKHIRIDALRAALETHGWVEGKNLVFERRAAEGNAERLAALAAELVQAKVDLILVFITPDAVAARQATSTIPILLDGVGADPVATGLVASLARPGGNITGTTWMTAEQGVKLLELLKELLPRVSKVAGLIGSAATEATRRALQRAAMADLRGKGIQALMRMPTPLTNTHAALITELALEQRLPYAGVPGDVDLGALLGFGVVWPDQHSRMAWYIDRIARGAKPADLPIERPTRFTPSVNLKTARALGVRLPPGFMVRVDRTI
jgi:putative tryptophan/tyrosine transport system substrate-binding protein